MNRPLFDRSGSGLSALWGEHGIPQDTEAGRKELGMKMEMRRHEKNEKAWKKIRRGWCVGSAEFREELLERMDSQVGLSHYGEELRESDEAKARRVIEEEIENQLRVEDDRYNKRSQIIASAPQELP